MAIRKITGRTSSIVVSSSHDGSGLIRKAITVTHSGIQAAKNLSSILIGKAHLAAEPLVDHIYYDRFYRELSGKFFKDYLLVPDRIKFDITTRKTDSVTVSEYDRVLISLGNIRYFFDAVTEADTEFFLIDKSRSDTISSSERITFASALSKTDQIRSTEHTKFQIETAKRDQFNAGERKYLGAGLRKFDVETVFDSRVKLLLNKSFNDPVGTEDLIGVFDGITYSTYMAKYDTAVAHEYFTSQWTANRSFEDFVSSLEKIIITFLTFREFNDFIVLTDQLYFFTDKTLADTVTELDHTSFFVTKQNFDTQEIVDSGISRIMEKSLKDSFIGSEQIFKYTDKVLASAFDQSDIIQKYLNKSLADSTAALDLTNVFDGLTYSWIKDVRDEFSLVDLVSKDVSKSLTDSISFADFIKITRLLSSTYADFITITDTVSKQVNKGLLHGIDVVSFHALWVDKVAADTTSLADQNFKYLDKVVLSNFTPADKLTKFMIKQLSDSTAALDLTNIFDGLTYSWIKDVYEYAPVIDTVNKIVAKSTADILTISDIIFISRLISDRYEDSIATHEQVSKWFNKTITESATASDRDRYFSVVELSPFFDDVYAAETKFTWLADKSPFETISTNDIITKFIGKNLADSTTMLDKASISDGVEYDAFKTFKDQLLAEDLYSKHIEKLQSEYLTTVDYIAIVKIFSRTITEDLLSADTISKDIFKVHTESITAADYIFITKLFNEEQIETVTITDSKVIFDFSKLISDNTEATDLANVFDGLTYYYSKDVLEYIAITDSFSKLTDKSVVEGLFVSDTQAKDVFKPVSEDLAVSDFKSIDYSKPVLDEVISQHFILKLLNKMFDNILAVADKTTFDWQAYKYDQIDLDSTMVRYFSKELADSTTILDLFKISEKISQVFLKYFADDLTADDFIVLQQLLGRMIFDTADTVDTAFKDISKSILLDLIVTDTPQLELGKSATNTVSTADSKYIWANKASLDSVEFTSRITSKYIAKLLQDAAPAVDLTSIFDGITYSYIKDIANTAPITDSNIKLIAKLQQDAVAVLEQIVITSLKLKELSDTAASSSIGGYYLMQSYTSYAGDGTGRYFVEDYTGSIGTVDITSVSVIFGGVNWSPQANSSYVSSIGIGYATPDRLVVLNVAYSPSVAVPLTYVKINETTATLIIAPGTVNTGRNQEIWYANIPDGTTASVTIVHSSMGSGGTPQAVAAHAVYNATSSVPVTKILYQNGNTGQPGTMSATTTVYRNSVAIAALTANGIASSAVSGSWTNLTETADVAVGANSTGVWTATGSYTFVTDASRTEYYEIDVTDNNINRPGLGITVWI